MGALVNPRFHSETAETSRSVSAVLAQMQTELRDLLTRREDLARRIRNLHQLTRGLHELAKAPVCNQIYAAPSPTPKNGSAPCACSRIIPEGSGQQAPSSALCKTNRMNLGLRRACRIALLEGEGPVSLEELYARILRRGSFSFVNLKTASPLLLRGLQALAEGGEAQLLENAPGLRWQRVERFQEV